MEEVKQSTENTFIPSVLQQDIFDFIENPSGNLVVSAVAGSGKTTTIIKSLSRIPKSENVLYLAFNKDIVESIKKKNHNMTNVTFKTLHGYGYSTLKDFNKNIEIDNYKYSKLLKDIYNFIKSGDLNELKKYNFNYDQIQNLDKFIIEKLEEFDDAGKLKQRILNLCGFVRMMLLKDISEVESAADKYGVEFLYNECELAIQLVELGEHFDTVIDFTDMIYFPIRFNIHGIKYSRIFIDECQDLNVAQKELMLMALKPGAKFVAVGDKKQAIYGFTGADTSSFENLINHPNTKELPLSVCYRCSKKIIDLSKEIVPEIEFFEKNGEGEVNYEASQNEIIPGDMVLCRNTYPLIRMCFDFLKKGIPATIKGRDIGLSLVQMIEDSKTEDILKMFSHLYAELEKTQKKIAKKHNLTDGEAKENEVYQNQKERIEIIELLSENANSCSSISHKIISMFSDNDNDGIQLSTIHKAKGLENDKVFIIHPELIPSKYAIRGWQIEQENNLRYVAYTRAKHYLGFVTDFDAYAGKSKFDKSAMIEKIQKPSFVGKPGDSVVAELTLIDRRQINTKHGATTLWKFRDNDGNIYVKFKDVPGHFYGINKEKPLKCRVYIKEHREFNNNKENSISSMFVIPELDLSHLLKEDKKSSLETENKYYEDIFETEETVDNSNNEKKDTGLFFVTYNNGIRQEVKITDLEKNHENLTPDMRIEILRTAMKELISEGKEPTIAQLNRKTNFANATVKKYLKQIEDLDKEL